MSEGPEPDAVEFAGAVRRVRTALVVAVLPGLVPLAVGLAGLVRPEWWASEVGAETGPATFFGVGLAIVTMAALAVLGVAYVRKGISPGVLLTPGTPTEPPEAYEPPSREESDPLGALVGEATHAVGQQSAPSADEGTDPVWEPSSGLDDGSPSRIAVVEIGSPDGEGGDTPADADVRGDRLPGDLDIAVHRIDDIPDDTWGGVLAAADAARTAVVPATGEAFDASADGIVVVDTSGTLPETAFALEVLTDLPVPVVVAGGTDGVDGGGTAIRAATNERFASGVHVVAGQELHSAREAVSHAGGSGVQSPVGGPVATITGDGVEWSRRPRRGVSAHPIDLGAEAVDVIPEIAVVQSGPGTGPDAIDRVLAAGVDGLVVEAAPDGTVPPSLVEPVAEAAETVPVVLASVLEDRAVDDPDGTVDDTADDDLLRTDLPPSKARIGLALGLGADRDRASIQELLR